jgi:hypothetical protein
VPLARPARATRGRLSGPPDEEVIQVLRHPRFRRGFIPVWRIAEAIAAPTGPASVRRALERLEAQGRVERRRAAPRQFEWRAAP